MKQAGSEGKNGKKRGYWAGRTNLMYYQYVDFMVRGLAPDVGSLIDVGSADARYIENFDWIRKRHALDIRKPYESESVEGIQMNFFDFQPEEKYDFATCLQVLEHIPDAGAFAGKLFQTAHRVLISVPYLWEEGSSSSHVHDPVGLEKLLGWTGREPDYHVVVQEPLVTHGHGRRLICYYHPEGETVNVGKARRKVTAPPAPPAGAGPARASKEQRRIHRKLGEIEAQLGQLGRALELERSQNRKLSNQRDNLKDRLRKRGADLKEARKGYNKAARERDRSNSLYAAIKQSNSWRYTSPIRKLADIIKSQALGGKRPRQ